MSRTSTCSVLLVFPKFNPKSFWSFEGVLHVVGARYPAAPLGLITVAGMLPPIGMCAWSTETPKS